MLENKQHCLKQGRSLLASMNLPQDCLVAAFVQDIFQRTNKYKNIFEYCKTKKLK